jgi:hypothetical protein
MGQDLSSGRRAAGHWFMAFRSAAVSCP